MTTTQKGGSALDQFLPERMFAVHAKDTAGATPIDPAEVHIEPIESLGAAAEPPVLPRVTPPGSHEQVWPMVAAAMVAIGVSLLAFAAFARFGAP